MATFIPNITDVFPKPALYETDFNFVDKVLQRKQAMYQQGLEKAKNSFDSVLYAPLSDSANFPIRDQYIKQAKEQLKSLTGADFSLPENITAAQNIFSPFWNDEFIIQDANLTKWYQSQAQKLSSWKDSSDPKTREQYSGITSMYLNNGLAKLKEAGRDKDKYSKIEKREAVPFVNVEKYLEEMAGKDPEKLKVVWDQQSPDGAYLISTINGERSKKKFSNWAQSMIGNNFYEQFRVSGVVENEERFKRIKGASPNLSDDEVKKIIASDVVSELSLGYKKREGEVNAEVAQIDALLRNLPKQLTPQNQEYANQLAMNKAELLGRKAGIEEEYKYFNTNNKDKLREYVTTSPDIYFSTLIKQRTIDNWATGRASIESKTVKENSAWFNAQNVELRRKELERAIRKDDWEMQKDIVEAQNKAISGTTSGTTSGGTKTGKTGTTEPLAPGQDPFTTGRFKGLGTTDVTGNRVTAYDVYSKNQDDLYLNANNNIFSTDGVLYLTKKGLGMSDGDLANISTALRKEIESQYFPEKGSYTFTKEENDAIGKLEKVLSGQEAVKNLGITVKGPGTLRNALLAYSQDYLSKKIEAGKDGKTDMFSDPDEFKSMMTYLTSLKMLDTYNANEENRKILLDSYLEKNKSNETVKKVITNKDGKPTLITESDLAADESFKKLGGKLINTVIAPLSANPFDLLSLVGKSYNYTDKELTSQKLATAFSKGELGITLFNQNMDKVFAKVSVNNNTYDVPEELVPEIQNILNKYGNSEDFTKTRKKVLETVVPDLLFYQTKTGKLGSEFSYTFDPSKDNDKAFLLLNESLNAGNASIYVTDASGKSDPADAKTMSAIRQLLADKEKNAEKYVQGFTYKTQGVNGRPTLFFSIGEISAKDENQVGGTNLNVLNQKSFSLELSPNVSGPTLQALPSNTGMQIFQQLLRGKPLSSDPILSAAGFNFTLTPNYTDNPSNVRLSLKYNLAVNERDPVTGEVKHVVKPVEDSRTLSFVGPDAKSPDEIVNYLYDLFRESMENNRKKYLEYENILKTSPQSTVVDRDALLRKLFGDNFVK